MFKLYLNDESIEPYIICDEATIDFKITKNSSRGKFRYGNESPDYYLINMLEWKQSESNAPM